MFLTPKKLKGVEKGSYCVLKRNVKDYANVATPNKTLLFNKYIEVMYVLSDNTFDCGNFCTVIPIIYDKHNTRQSSLPGVMSKKYRNSTKRLGRLYTFHKDDLELLQEPLEEYMKNHTDVHPSKIPNIFATIEYKYGHKVLHKFNEYQFDQ